MNEIPSKYDQLTERARSGKSRKDSIHIHCLECMGYEREQVRRCLNRDCVFWFWRPYKTPQELSGNGKKRQIKRKSDNIDGSRLSKVIEIKNPPEGKYRLRVELVPEGSVAALKQ
jgi:hypothetical protein